MPHLRRGGDPQEPHDQRGARGQPEQRQDVALQRHIGRARARGQLQRRDRRRQDGLPLLPGLPLRGDRSAGHLRPFGLHARGALRAAAPGREDSRRGHQLGRGVEHRAQPLPDHRADRHQPAHGRGAQHVRRAGGQRRRARLRAAGGHAGRADGPGRGPQQQGHRGAARHGDRRLRRARRARAPHPHQPGSGHRGESPAPEQRHERPPRRAAQGLPAALLRHEDARERHPGRRAPEGMPPLRRMGGDPRPRGAAHRRGAGRGCRDGLRQPEIRLHPGRPEGDLHPGQARGGDGHGPHRHLRDAQAVGLPDLLRAHVAHVLVHVQPRGLSAGVDRRAGGLDRRCRERAAARRGAARPAFGRRDRRRGVGDRLPAADHDPLPLHLVHGGLGLPRPRSLHHGPRDAPHRPARQVVHPAHHGLRLQRAGHHGLPHHRKPQQPSDYHTHYAVHVMQCTTSDLHPRCRDLLPGQRRAGHDGALPAGHRGGRRHGTPHAALPLPGRRNTLRHGVAALPPADLENNPLAHVGQVCAVPQEDGRHDPHRLAHRLVPELLSTPDAQHAGRRTAL